MSFKKIIHRLLIALILGGCILPGYGRLRTEINVPLANVQLTTATPGVTVAIPSEQMPKAILGYLDVTLEPYNADPTGATDATEALKRALTDTMLNNLVAYFPLGTYKVSSSLDMERPSNLVATGLSDKKFGFMMVGELGANGALPTLQAEDNSNFVVTYGSDTKDVVLNFRFTNVNNGEDLPPSLYSTMVKNFHIDMGDNASSSGIALDGAQNCSIENVRVTGEHFFAGVLTTPGSGGSATGITVEGGDYGIYFPDDAFRPSPSVHGIKLIDQRLAGFVGLSTRGNMTIVGAEIRAGSHSDPSWVGIRAENISKWGGNFGCDANLQLIDSLIETNADTQVAIKNVAQDLYVKNVYVKAKTVIESGGSSLQPFTMASNAWTLLQEVAYLFDDDVFDRHTLINDVRYDASSVYVLNAHEPVASAPTDLTFIERHTADLFEFSSPLDAIAANFEVFNIMTDGAVPATADDDSDDDVIAINATIQAAVAYTGPKPVVVFIPRGHFEVSDEIVVPTGIILAGAANNISVLEASIDWRPNACVSLLRTGTGAQRLVLQNFALFSHEATEDRGYEHQKYITLFNVGTSDTVMCDVLITRMQHFKASSFFAPMGVFAAGAGGRVYNLNSDDVCQYIKDENGDEIIDPSEDVAEMSPSYRQVLIEGANGLSFYQFNVEHAAGEAQVEVSGSAAVSFFGASYEPPAESTYPGTTWLRIRNSSGVSVFGASGIYGIADPTKSIVDVDVLSTDYTLVNFSRQRTSTTAAFGFFDDGINLLDRNQSIFLVRKGNVTASAGTPIGSGFWITLRDPDLVVDLSTCVLPTTTTGPTTADVCFLGPLPGDITSYGVIIRTLAGTEVYRSPLKSAADAVGYCLPGFVLDYTGTSPDEQYVLELEVSGSSTGILRTSLGRLNETAVGPAHPVVIRVPDLVVDLDRSWLPTTTKDWTLADICFTGPLPDDISGYYLVIRTEAGTEVYRTDPKQATDAYGSWLPGFLLDYSATSPTQEYSLEIEVWGSETGVLRAELGRLNVGAGGSTGGGSANPVIVRDPDVVVDLDTSVLPTTTTGSTTVDLAFTGALPADIARYNVIIKSLAGVEIFRTPLKRGTDAVGNVLPGFELDYSMTSPTEEYILELEIWGSGTGVLRAELGRLNAGSSANPVVVRDPDVVVDLDTSVLPTTTTGSTTVDLAFTGALPADIARYNVIIKSLAGVEIFRTPLKRSTDAVGNVLPGFELDYSMTSPTEEYILELEIWGSGTGVLRAELGRLNVDAGGSTGGSSANPVIVRDPDVVVDLDTSVLPTTTTGSTTVDLAFTGALPADIARYNVIIKSLAGVEIFRTPLKRGTDAVGNVLPGFELDYSMTSPTEEYILELEIWGSGTGVLRAELGRLNVGAGGSSGGGSGDGTGGTGGVATVTVLENDLVVDLTNSSLPTTTTGSNIADVCFTGPFPASVVRYNLRITNASGVEVFKTPLKRSTDADGYCLRGFVLDFSNTDPTEIYHLSLEVWGSTIGGVRAELGLLNETPAVIAATVTLEGLAQTYDGSAKSVAVSTQPANLVVTVTYDGASEAPVDAGEYEVVATVTAATYQGSATRTLVIAPAAAEVVLGQLVQPYDGEPKIVSVQTQPVGLPVEVTYVDSADGPVDAGIYPVVATVTDANYVGTSVGTLTISPAVAEVTLGKLVQSYDGLPKAVDVSIAPENLNVSVTYNDSTELPLFPGESTVVAVVSDPNYVGTATDTLSIQTTALVREGFRTESELFGSIHVLDQDDVTLLGNALVSGDLLITGLPELSLIGHPVLGGRLSGLTAAEQGDHRVALIGHPTLRYLVDSVALVAMPTVVAPGLPAGTTDVVIRRNDQEIGDPSALRNLTVLGSAGEVALPPGTYGDVRVIGDNTLTLGVTDSDEVAVYELQSLNLLARAELRVVGPVLLRVGELTSFATMERPANAQWLTTHVAVGDFKLLGKAQWWGTVVAPAGGVEILNSTLCGRVAAARLKLLGNAELIDPEISGENP